jgi:dTDP-4-dehydrorhamnose 3,5-epimerase-like enzyme
VLAVDLKRIVDDRGTLYAVELAELGIEPIRRIAFITGVVPGSSRGGHAHREQAEYVVCISGGVDVRLESRGVRTIVPLRVAGRIVQLPPGCWRELVGFAPGTVLALLSPHPFDESDYLRDYDEFRTWETRSE